jgi:hypothetical protein
LKSWITVPACIWNVTLLELVFAASYVKVTAGYEQAPSRSSWPGEVAW